MKDSEIKDLPKKLAITDIAAQLYIENNGSFSLHDIAAQTDLTVGQIFNYFSGKQEILQFYYTSVVIRYRLMIEEIDDFSNFTLSEKLSNFAYASFDMMQEREEFVKRTFRSQILHHCKKTAYEHHIEKLFSDFFKNDSGKSAAGDALINEFTLSLIRKKYLLLVNIWLNDKSDDKEVTLELVDKVTGLLEEVLYTSVLDRTVDLAKFFYSNRILQKQVPCLNKLTSSFEIR